METISWADHLKNVAEDLVETFQEEFRAGRIEKIVVEMCVDSDQDRYMFSGLFLRKIDCPRFFQFFANELRRQGYDVCRELAPEYQEELPELEQSGVFWRYRIIFTARTMAD